MNLFRRRSPASEVVLLAIAVQARINAGLRRFDFRAQ
jgi:hypothetical protein